MFASGVEVKVVSAVYVDVFDREHEEREQDEEEQRSKKGLPVKGPDGLYRPPWATRSKVMRDYYDAKWGNVETGEQELFETLSLLILQAGLFWGASLARRDQLALGLHGFDPDILAEFDEVAVAACLENPEQIRNRRKIEAIVQNAKATVALREEGGLEGVVWSHRPQVTPRPVAFEDVPTVTGESTALAKSLKEKGFTFVGPSIAYALMQATGVVDTNLLGTHKRGASGLWNEDGTRAVEVSV